MKTQTCLALMLSMLLVAGCGGGDGNNDDQQLFEEQTLTLNLDRNLSGYLSQNGFESPTSDSFVGTIPDVAGFLETRGIFTFDLSSLPADATLVSAELKALQGAKTGTPYVQVARILIDHIVGLADGVSFTDFNSLPQETMILSEDDVEEFKTLDVTPQVAADMAADRGESKWRLRGQAINPLTAGNNDDVDPVDLARFLTDAGETVLEVVVRVPVENPAP